MSRKDCKSMLISKSAHRKLKMIATERGKTIIDFMDFITNIIYQLFTDFKESKRTEEQKFEEKRRKQSESMKKKWQDPEFRNRVSKGKKLAGLKREKLKIDEKIEKLMNDDR